MSLQKEMIGKRVQLHPATDAWMQGDRYGRITGLGKALPNGERPYRVKLDVSGRSRLFHPDNVFTQ